MAPCLGEALLQANQDGSQLTIAPGVVPSEYDDRTMGQSDGDMGKGQSQGWVMTTGQLGREDKGRERERGGSEGLEVKMNSGHNSGSKM